MLNRKPQPLYAPQVRKRCPVCGEVSYSAAGIHPQCAMHQADAEHLKRIKPHVHASKRAAKPIEQQRWQKVCPKCRALAHVRKKVCDCGHAFAGMNSS